MIADIRAGLASEDEETRRGALQRLRDLPLSDSLNLVFLAMGDQSWRIRKEAVEVFLDAEIDDDAVRRLLDLLRDHDNAGLRNSAAEAAIKLGARAAGPLIALADDPDPDVRKFVLDVMGAVRINDFLPTLRKALNDTDLNVAAAAAEHLGSFGSPAIVSDLIGALISRDSVHFRFNALAALGRIGWTLSVPAEIVALADQEILRRPVYDCLGRIGDERCAAILLKGFSCPRKSSRNAAVTAWYRIFSRATATGRQELETSLRLLSGSEIVTDLMEGFDPEEGDLAEAVTAVLGIIGDLRAAPVLLKGFACERLSGIALTSLKRLGPGALDTLISLYPNETEASRGAICSFIGERRYADGTELVRSGLSDESPLVRKAAAAAAGNLAVAGFAGELLGLLEDADFEVRSAAMASLQKLCDVDPQSVLAMAYRLEESEDADRRRDAAKLYASLGERDRLSLLVKDPAPEVRQAAVCSLGTIAVSHDMNILMISLVDEDPDVRIAAAEALGAAGTVETVDALMPALGDEDPWVVSAVLRSIARLDRSRVVAAIRSVLSAAEDLIMITCLELLEQTGTREAIELVEVALNSGDNDVVSSAVSILARQGGEWVMANAERLLGHPNPEARIAWAGVLAGLPLRQARTYLAPALEKETDERVRDRIAALVQGSI